MHAQDTLPATQNHRLARAEQRFATAENHSASPCLLVLTIKTIVWRVFQKGAFSRRFFIYFDFFVKTGELLPDY